MKTDVKVPSIAIEIMNKHEIESKDQTKLISDFLTGLLNEQFSDYTENCPEQSLFELFCSEF